MLQHSLAQLRRNYDSEVLVGRALLLLPCAGTGLGCWRVWVVCGNPTIPTGLGLPLTQYSSFEDPPGIHLPQKLHEGARDGYFVDIFPPQTKKRICEIVGMGEKV